MKYVVDRVEGEKVILESLEDKAKLEALKEDFDFELRDGLVVEIKDGKYVLDDEEYKKRKESISSRFDKLKKNKAKKN